MKADIKHASYGVNVVMQMRWRNSGRGKDKYNIVYDTLSEVVNSGGQLHQCSLSSKFMVVGNFSSVYLTKHTEIFHIMILCRICHNNRKKSLNEAFSCRHTCTEIWSNWAWRCYFRPRKRFRILWNYQHYSLGQWLKFFWMFQLALYSNCLFLWIL